MTVRSRLRTRRWDHAIVFAAAVVAVLLVSYPVIFVAMRSVSPEDVGSGFTLKWLEQLVTSTQIRQALLNTLIYTVGCTATSMITGVALAFITARTNLPLRRAIAAMAVAPILVPPFILVVGWSALGDPRAGFINIIVSKLAGHATTLVNIDSMPGIIWVTGLFLSPYAFLLTTAGFRSMDTTMEEAARVAGSGRLRLLRTVTFPVQRPALVAALLLVMVMSAGDFVIPSTLGLQAHIDLLPSLIWKNTNSFPGAPGLAAAQALVLVLVGLICIFFQRRAVSGSAQYATVAGRGAEASVVDLGRARYLLGVVAALYVLCASALPLLAVTAMAFVRYWTPTALSPRNLTLGNFRYVLFHYPQIWPSVEHSLILALLGATICLTLALAITWYLYRLKGRLAPLVSYALVLPLGVPGIALGVGILNTWILVPGGIYGTLWILLVAYVTAFLPIAQQFVGSALQQIHGELEDASRIAGRSLVGTVRLIVLPLIRPALLGGWLALYVVILREISLVILLYNPSTIVVSVGLLDVWDSGYYPQLAVYALLLLALGVLPVAMLGRLTRTRSGRGGGS